MKSSDKQAGSIIFPLQLMYLNVSGFHVDLNKFLLHNHQKLLHMIVQTAMENSK